MSPRILQSDFALIATNTMHKVIREVRERTRLPVLSIVDATIDALEEERRLRRRRI